ncbi:MAG: glycosyltransferase family 2 protein, partial [Clostridia bacterium]|nr:glycosyltransferase family 2 protein [Clostridia bacterium]
MENCKFLFSVIVPVYKVEEYLRETLCSLENQTIGFENIQLIIVNDGSTDKSGEICREFQNQHNENVIYIEKENGGVSSARNAGMPFIEGKYVNFLDAD